MQYVSVIIPVYNDELYITECLHSVIEQTYQYIEIIVIDDGSTDQTAAIVKSFSDKVKYIYQKNDGPSAARNTGINNATGDYITFVDADDIIDQTMISRLVTEINLNHADIAICGLNQFTIKNNKRKEIVDYPGETKVVKENKNIFQNLYPYFNTEMLNPPYGRIYKLDLIRNINLQFDESLSLGEDFIFNLNYFSTINCYCSLGESLYHYRRGNNYLTKKYSGDFSSGKKLMFTKARHILTNYNVSKSFLNEQFIVICFSYFLELPNRLPDKSYCFKRQKIKEILFSDDVKDAIKNVNTFKVKILASILKLNNTEIVYLSAIILNYVKKIIKLRY